MKIGLVPAAGMARRLNINMPKELLTVAGKPVISYSIDNLLAGGINHIVVVIRKGKESIRDYLLSEYPDTAFEFVYQRGDIGNLLDAIKCAADAIRGHTVHFCMPDTIVTPAPFTSVFTSELKSSSLQLLCFRSNGDSWQHFGVVDQNNNTIVDKPKTYCGNICWGALIWQPEFTEQIIEAQDFTATMNATKWSHHLAIDRYRDIGVVDALDHEQLSQIQEYAN